jgi:acylphosphatase
MKERIEFKVFGRVQGVGFRYSVVRSSKKFQVKGFVENLPSGEVLVTAEGEKEALKKFLEEVKNYTFTEITKVEVEWKKAENKFTEFRIRY